MTSNLLRWMFAVGATTLLGCGQAPGAEVATISVDASRTYQTMTGWEGTIDLRDGEERRRFLDVRDEVLERTANEVGINRVRLEIRAGAENRARAFARFDSGEIAYEQWRPLRYVTENDNSDPKVIDWSGFDFSEFDAMIEEQLLPMRKLLAKRGERLHVNLCYVAFTNQTKGSPYNHDDPEEYAEFVLATYLHLQKKFGFVPDTWEVILEPDLVPQWTPRHTALAIKAAGRRLRENGFTPRFVAPSVTNTANAVRYIEAIAREKAALNDVVEFSYHRYRQAKPATVRAVAELGERYGKATAMLELWFGRATSRVLFEDLTIGNVSAFQGRSLGGYLRVDQSASGKPEFSMRKDARMNSEVFTAVRIGARRVDARSDKGGAAKPVAFVNVDGRMAVAVLTTGPASLAFEGLAPGGYEARYGGETKSGTIAALVTVGKDGRATAAMPEAGVFALVQKSK